MRHDPEAFQRLGGRRKQATRASENRRRSHCRLENRLFTATLRRALGQRRKVALAAFDSTGLQCGRASSYFVRGKKEWQTTTYKRFAKLEAAVDCATHPQPP